MPMEQERPKYKKYLVDFMSFRDEHIYNHLETVLTQEELVAIAPAEIESWMCQKVEIQQSDTGEQIADKRNCPTVFGRNTCSR